MKWLILVVLAVGAIPAVYAEVGYDYTIIENDDGTATWTSHEPYYFDGAAFVPYQLTEDANILQVQLAEGKFVFDKNACAVSLFDQNGIVIDSDSYIVRSAVLGTDDWFNLAVNDEQCTTRFTETDDSITVHFEKQNEEGLFDTEYLISKGQLKTTAKFTNEQYDNHKFAFTQTVHVPNEITLNEQTINISDYTGQSFPREVLEQNVDLFIEAKGLLYNAGVGFDNLWAVSIHDDNRVALDYANVAETQTPIGETVELDPTYTNSSPSDLKRYQNCSSYTTSSTRTSLQSMSTSSTCLAGAIEFDVSSISSSATITSAELEYDVTTVSGTSATQLVAISGQPSVTADSTTWSEIKNSTTVLDTVTQTSTTSGTSLSSTVTSDFNSKWSTGAYWLGYDYPNNTGSLNEWKYLGNLQLTVVYTVPTVPDAITDLSATHNDPNVDLAWTLPNDGGSAITSFKVYRDIGSGYSLYDTVVSATATSYQDTNPSAGVTNYYKVNAVNSLGEASDSNVASVYVGTPPDPPTGVSTSIADADAAPLTITVSWTSPSNVGTGTLTGFEIYRDGTLITTTGLVTTYDDTVPSSGTYVYKVRAVSTDGTSVDSNTSSISTPTVPTAINDLAGQVNSNIETSISWTAPSTGGSAITQYKVFRDSINIGNTTSTSFTDSGLTDGTTYLYNVFSQNNVGTSTKSNDLSLTTYTSVTGSISGTATTIGATSQLIVNATVTAGTPTPNFNTFVVKEGANVITTFTGTTDYIHHTDESPHTYTIESTDSSHWQQPTISGTISGVTSQYSPTWVNNAAYNYTRGGGTFDLTVNRDIPAGWDLDCEYRTSTQAAANQTGVHGIGSNMWAYSDTQSIADGKHVYVTCMDGNTQVVSFTSYGPNLIQGGLNLLDTNFGDYLGAPAALLFVLLAAGMFTGRTANTGILVVLALIGVLGFIGMLAIDETVWGFVLIAGVLGLFVGRRFL